MKKKYTENYRKTNQRGLDSNAYIALSGDLPRFAIETISFSAILLFAILLLINSSSSASAVSILSIYAIAGYKLLPTMQQIYKSISSISANGGVVLELKSNLDVLTHKHHDSEVNPLNNVKTIKLQNISYTYPNTKKIALDNISLVFDQGKLNTIAGPSGSGKSTLADVILGLLPAAGGQLLANNEKIQGELLKAYQGTIGYVPQHIFILDDNVIANVAFGVEKDSIDKEKVIKALRQANAMEFVDKLPNGMDTGLGQDGKLLSGGQRQRIGIARALYRNNNILVLDEPTSALDIESEHELMNLLNHLKHEVLIIVISHRPAAIKLSDKISVIADGKLVANGEYSSLYEGNSYFRSMIEKGFIN